MVIRNILACLLTLTLGSARNHDYMMFNSFENTRRLTPYGTKFVHILWAQFLVYCVCICLICFGVVVVQCDVQVQCDFVQKGRLNLLFPCKISGTWTACMLRSLGNFKEVEENQGEVLNRCITLFVQNLQICWNKFIHRDPASCDARIVIWCANTHRRHDANRAW